MTTNAFFIPTQYGIQDACALLGCTYQWTGSENSIVRRWSTRCNTAISAKADGIAVAIVDPKAFDAPTQKALQAGIPVVSYNADSPTPANNGRLAYIGQDLFESGVALGSRIVSLVAVRAILSGLSLRRDHSTSSHASTGKGGDSAVWQRRSISSRSPRRAAGRRASRSRGLLSGPQNLKGMVAVDGGSTQGWADHAKVQPAVQRHPRRRAMTWSR